MSQGAAAAGRSDISGSVGTRPQSSSGQEKPTVTAAAKKRPIMASIPTNGQTHQTSPKKADQQIDLWSICYLMVLGT